MTHKQLLEHFSPTDDENSKQDLHFNSLILGEKTPNQCRIEGRAPTLFIEQTEARRAEKKFLETAPSLTSEPG